MPFRNSANHKPCSANGIGYGAVTAVWWKSAGSIGRIVVQLGATAVLARLLDPVEFGLVAKASIFIALGAVITDLGLAPAIVQMRHPVPRALRTANTLSILLGLFAVGVVYLAAPVVAWALHDPRLVPILRMMGLSLGLACLGAVPYAILQRSLRFGSLAFADIVSYVIGFGLVGITMALLGSGAYALVYATIAQAATRTVIWIARADVPFQFGFSRTAVRKIYRFGGMLTVARIMNAVARNADYLIVSVRLGDRSLGFYSRAYQLVTMPFTELAGNVSAVTFPAYSRLQASPDRSRLAYIMTIRIAALVLAPLSIFVAVIAPELIALMFGPGWEEAVVPAMLLATVGSFRGLYNIADSMVRANGAVAQQAVRHGIYAILVIAGAFVGSAYGIAGVSAAVGVSILVMYLMMSHLALRVIGGHWPALLQAHIPGMLLAVAMLILYFPVSALRSNGASALVIILVAVFSAFAAVGLATLIRSVRHALQEAVNIGLNRKLVVK